MIQTDGSGISDDGTCCACRVCAQQTRRCFQEPLITFESSHVQFMCFYFGSSPLRPTLCYLHLPPASVRVRSSLSGNQVKTGGALPPPRQRSASSPALVFFQSIYLLSGQRCRPAEITWKDTHTHTHAHTPLHVLHVACAERCPSGSLSLHLCPATSASWALL